MNAFVRYSRALLMIFLSVLMMCATAAFALDAPGFSELCRTRTIEQVRAALAAGADIEERDEFENTPLISALGGVGRSGSINPNPDLEVARFLIRNGADVNAVVKIKSVPASSISDTMSPLNLAVMRQPDLVVDLVEAGANVNERSFLGTPLIYALRKAETHPELYKFLLRQGADVNFDSPPWGSPLSVSLWVGGSTLEAVNDLLDAGADINAVSRERNYTPAIQEQDYMQIETGDFMKRYRGNSVGSLVKTLYNGRNLSRGDLQELKEWLAERT